MQAAHGWVAAALTALILSTGPAACAPKRIVSTFLCTDEYVFRLVPRGQIAALSFEATDRHPVVSTIADAAAGIPAIRPSAETVMTFDPDLVVMYAGTMPALHAALDRAHVPVLDVPWANSLSDIRRVTALLGDKLGARERARALLKEMDATLARARGAAPKPPVRTLVYEPNGYSATGGMTGEIMALSGLADMGAVLGHTRLDTLPIEAVIAHPPELLILSGDPRLMNSRADLVQHHPALATVPSTVAWAELTPLLCPGPWSADAAMTFTRLAAKAVTTKGRR
ncbi:MAG: ABC transporter substrate-binding protein [Alphaproteobacteria bacterium]|nr:ABC transporter substrate-binding protein [Alphaproteobacteria bacterium]